MSTKDKAERVKTDAELAEGYDPEATPDPPVYDERGNVRPRGTPGAKPMTLAQRKEIARRLAEEADPDKPAKQARRTTRKAAARRAK